MKVRTIPSVLVIIHLTNVIILGHFVTCTFNPPKLLSTPNSKLTNSHGNVPSTLNHLNCVNLSSSDISSPKHLVCRVFVPPWLCAGLIVHQDYFVISISQTQTLGLSAIRYLNTLGCPALLVCGPWAAGLFGALMLYPPTNWPRDIPTGMKHAHNFHTLWQFITVQKMFHPLWQFTTVTILPI